MKLSDKFLLIICSLIVTIFAATAFFTFSSYKESIKNTISQQQFLMISIFADEIDNNLSTAQQQLLAFAETVPHGIMKNPEKAQALLDRSKDLDLIFDNHIFLFTPKGKLFVESPYLPGRRGLDFSLREYIKKTVQTKQTYISDPYISLQSHKHASIIMTVPFFDRKGELAGILGGGIDLMKTNFMDWISNVKVGETGNFYLYAADGTMIMHPDKTMILVKQPRGLNKLYDMARDGFEGTGETTTSYGLKAVSSFKRLKTKNWILAANYPQDEAYLPIRKAELYFLIATATGMIVILFITFFIVRRLTDPIEVFTRHVQNIWQKEGHDRFLNITTKDEIGTLSRAFNHMIATIDDDITERKKAADTLKKKEENFRNLIDRNPVAMAVAEKNGKFIFFNDKFIKTFGYTLDDISTVDDWWPLAYPDEEYRQKVIDAWKAGASKAIEDKKETDTKDWTVTCKNGTLRDIEFRMASMEDLNIVIFYDVTERKKFLAALSDQERYMSSLIQNSPMATFVLNMSHKITIWNKACEKLTGREESEMLGTDYHWQPFYQQIRPTLADIIIEGNYDKLSALYDNHSSSALNVNGIKAERWFNSLGGEKRYLVFNAAPILDSKGNMIAAIETLQDISASKKLEDELIHQALYDSLTGLPNRILLRDRIQNLYNHNKRQTELLFAALFIDLDDFKKINDSLGHMTGDELLLSVTKRLNDAIRPGDTISRFGGDEFVVLLDNVSSPKDAISVAKRINEFFSEVFNLEDHEVFISASIGIALSDSAPGKPDDLLRNADIAMYSAKESGKARYILFDGSMSAAIMDSVGIENDLRKALKMGEISVHYQPIMDVRTKIVAGFEALARWVHPVKGYIPPAHFIPIAEKIGIIEDIGILVMKKACMDIKELNSKFSASFPFYVSVNLSAKQFNTLLPQMIADILAETGFDSGNLRVEITESTIMENIITASSVLDEIKRMGVQVYLDDFGTGYSSLNYLHKFPVDALKIDPSFTRNISEDKQAMEILKSVFKLANNLDMKMIIEGVESQEALSVFKDLDFQFLQGYLFSRPVSSEKLFDLMNKSGLISDDVPGLR